MRAGNLLYTFLRAPPKRASAGVCFLLTSTYMDVARLDRESRGGYTSSDPNDLLTEGFSISRLEGSRWWLRRRGYGGRTLMARSEADGVFGRKRGRAAETGRFLQVCKCHRDTCSGGGRMRASVQTHECVGMAGACRVVTDVLQHYDESRIGHRRRISAALNSCRTSMLAPQRGQCQLGIFSRSTASTGGETASSRRHNTSD